MADVIHADIAYSFRKIKPVIGEVTPDNRTLVAIEQLLVNAGQAYRGRRYLEAIDLYQQARSILWSQLFPLIALDEKWAWATDLRLTLVSYSAEWLNVLPIEHASAGVRPREQVAIDTGPVLGLLSSNVANASGATADLGLAVALEARGNTASAKFFRDRATTLAPALVDQIEAADTPATPAPPLRPGVFRPTEDLRVERPAAGVRILSPAARFEAFAPGPIERPVPVEIPPQLTVAQRSYSVQIGDVVQQIAGTPAKHPRSI